jgi:hypothetical protein
MGHARTSRPRTNPGHHGRRGSGSRGINFHRYAQALALVPDQRGVIRHRHRVWSAFGGSTRVNVHHWSVNRHGVSAGATRVYEHHRGINRSTRGTPRCCGFAHATMISTTAAARQDDQGRDATQWRAPSSELARWTSRGALVRVHKVAPLLTLRLVSVSLPYAVGLAAARGGTEVKDHTDTWTMSQ